MLAALISLTFDADAHASQQNMALISRRKTSFSCCWRKCWNWRSMYARKTSKKERGRDARKKKQLYRGKQGCRKRYRAQRRHHTRLAQMDANRAVQQLRSEAETPEARRTRLQQVLPPIRAAWLEQLVAGIIVTTCLHDRHSVFITSRRPQCQTGAVATRQAEAFVAEKTEPRHTPVIAIRGSLKDGELQVGFLEFYACSLFRAVS